MNSAFISKLKNIKIYKRLKPRKLTLPEAIVFASIVAKYVDTESNPNAVDFVGVIVEKLTPEEYLQCVKMITNITEEDLDRASIEILTAFIEGLKANQVFTLVTFWKSLEK